MTQKNQLYRQTEGDAEQSLFRSGKERSDIMILRYMVRRTYARLLDLPSDTPLPTVDYVEERHLRTHRVVIYKPHELLRGSDLFFVGFVSRVADQVDPSIVQEIRRVDKLLVIEVASNPGLFSYSSLEVRKGSWYNLVVLSDSTAKRYFRHLDMHTYAAHQLTPSYYRWIRLHNGLIPGGLLSGELVLQSTKYYTFPLRSEREPVFEKEETHT